MLFKAVHKRKHKLQNSFFAAQNFIVLSRHVINIFKQMHSLKQQARLAQSVEHGTLNPRVVGSSPTLGDQLFYFFLMTLFFIFQVLFRMNLLTFLLCLVMNRPYQFYYFVPSVSFWFMVQFMVLLLPPQVSIITSIENDHE